MASSAPSPASPTTAAPPPSPSPSSEVSPPTSQATQPNANPPEATASSPPPPTSVSPPPSTPSPPPSSTTSPPPSSPPPPPTSASPPPQTVTPPPAESPPPTTTTSPPPSSPPPPVAVPPPASSTPPPAAASPPKSSPSPPPPPPASSTSPEPSPSPPPPSPQNSPPSPSSPSPPPTGSSSSPPPVSPSSPPKSSPPSPPSPPAASPPSSSPPPKSSTPSPPTSLSPPISPVSALSPPPPSIPQSSPTSPAANSTSSSKSEIPTAGIAAIAGVVGVLVILAVGLVVWFVSKRNRKRKTYEYPCAYVAPSSAFGSSPASDVNLIIKTHAASSYDRSSPGSGNLTPTSQGGYGNSRSFFTYRELYEATDGFAAENLLGEGGFGCVYKGILTDGKEVAVKQLKIGGGQGEREFKAEVESISRIHHRHLVSLVGYCIFESRRLLVYEYVPNKTLYYHLHGEGTPVASWATRIKIAVGTARGIAYLHEDCHPRIIHRDIKSSNILLDNNFEARVSDFGLAKLALDVDTHISTRVMGTFGYMAPEYATTGKLTDKSDVFSFGVVLLELITGRKPVDESQPLGDESLVEWARPLLSNALETGETESLVDPRLEKSYIEGEMLVMIEAAAACVRHSAAKRPRMGQVVRAFENLFPSDLSNGMRVGESKIYDSAQQASDIRWFRKMAFGSQNDFSSDLFSEPSQNFGLSGERRSGEGISSIQRSQNDSSRQQSPNIFSMRQRSYQNLQYSGQSSGQSSTPYVDSSTSGESQIN